MMHKSGKTGVRLDALWRICCALLLAVSGATAASCPAYGTPGPPLPHDPTTELLDFTYMPASPIHVGDTLALRVVLNHTAPAGFVRATFKHPGLATAPLSDHGAAPDEVAGDGIYSGELVWSAALGDGKDLPVYAELVWHDGAPGLRRDAPPLTILPGEE